MKAAGWQTACPAVWADTNQTVVLLSAIATVPNRDGSLIRRFASLEKAWNGLGKRHAAVALPVAEWSWESNNPCRKLN